MDDSLRQTQAYFGPRANAYRTSRSHANTAELAGMLSRLGPVEGRRALDVATGGGHTARALAQAGAGVIACDATFSMLVDVPWPAVVADAQRLPFVDESFDIVASRIAPHHFPDLPSFAQEAARVLVPGGRLYVFDLTSPTDARVADVIHRVESLRDPSHVRSHTPEAWTRALDAAGLHVAHIDVSRSLFDLEPWIARSGMVAADESHLRDLLTTLRPGDGYGIQPDGRMAVLRVEFVAVKAAISHASK